MIRTCGDSGGVKKDGTPCGGTLNLSSTSGLCFVHDPERMAQREAMRTAAGKATADSKRRAKAALPEAVPGAPKTLADATRISAWITRAVLVGEIDVRVAESATKAVRQFQLCEEKRALQREIEALRKELADAKRRK